MLKSRLLSPELCPAGGRRDARPGDAHLASLSPGAMHRPWVLASSARVYRGHDQRERETGKDKDPARDTEGNGEVAKTKRVSWGLRAQVSVVMRPSNHLEDAKPPAHWWGKRWAPRGTAKRHRQGPQARTSARPQRDAKAPPHKPSGKCNISHNSHRCLAREGGEATDPEPQEGLCAPREACLRPTPGRGEWWK